MPVEEPPIKPTRPKGTGVRSTAEAKPPGASWSIGRVLGGIFTLATILYEGISLYRGIVELPKGDPTAYHEGVKTLYFRTIELGTLIGLGWIGAVAGVGLLHFRTLMAGSSDPEFVKRFIEARHGGGL